MFSLYLIKIKLLTLLSMVFMGLFSRLVLGFPMLLPISMPLFHTPPDNHQFPDGGSRPSLRFMPVSRYPQRRRRTLKDGRVVEEELTFLQDRCDDTNFEFVGEVIDQANDNFNSYFTFPSCHRI